MLALHVIQGSTARRSEIRAPEKHVGADPRSGVYPTEPGDPGRFLGWSAGMGVETGSASQRTG